MGAQSTSYINRVLVVDEKVSSLVKVMDFFFLNMFML